MHNTQFTSFLLRRPIASALIGASGLALVIVLSAATAGARESDPCNDCLKRASALFASGKGARAAELLREWQAKCPDSARLHLLLSTILIRQYGKADEAAGAAERAVQIDPRSVAAHLQYGLSLMAAGRQKEAAAAFERLTALEPTSYEGWSALGNLYSQMGEKERAARCASKAACLEPGSRDARLKTVASLKAAGKLKEARRELSDLVDDDQLEPEFFIIVAGEASRAGAHVEAIKAADRALSSYPGLASCLTVKAEAQLWLHRYDKALETLSRLDETESECARPLSIKSLSLLKLGRGKLARKILNRGLSVSKEDEPLLLLCRGIVLSFDGRYKEAIASLEQSLAGDQRFAPTHVELARIYLKLGDAQKALEEAREIARCLDRASTARALEARAALASGPARKNMEEAISLAKQALKLNDGDPEALIARSMCDLKGGRIDLTRDNLDRALDIEPGSIDAMVVSARLETAQGQTKAAMSLLKKALTLAPGECEVLEAISETYKTTGQVDKAIKLLKSSLKGKVSPRTAYVLARIYQAQGKNRQAARYFRESLIAGINSSWETIALDAIKASKGSASVQLTK